MALPHGMRAPDRDAFFKLNDAFMAVHPEFQSIYYGLEDGMFAGHGFSSRIANYREPGHSGYLLDDTSGEVRAQEEGMEKYFKYCLNSTNGDLLDCEMAVGGMYTSCINDCELIKCADELSRQENCTTTNTSSNTTMNTTECDDELSNPNIKWCINYEILEATNETRRGYILRGTHCINSYGVPDETEGNIVKEGTEEKGNC
jgi:hypothetical protein